MELLKKLFYKYKEIILYTVFGVLTTLVNYISFVFFRKVIILPLLIANLVAWVLSVAFAFYTNKKYVFENKEKNILFQLISFFAARVISFIIFDEALLYIMVQFLGINELIAKLVANIFVVVFNYIASKIVIFKKGA